jgi:hypothetical protein
MQKVLVTTGALVLGLAMASPTALAKKCRVQLHLISADLKSAERRRRTKRHQPAAALQLCDGRRHSGTAQNQARDRRLQALGEQRGSCRMRSGVYQRAAPQCFVHHSKVGRPMSASGQKRT